MKKIFPILALFTCLIVIFFYPVFLKGYVPFPGDLLLAEYQPWRSYSYTGVAAGAIPNKGQYFDVLRQMYPWKTFEINSLNKGVFPLWNPYNFSGSPLFANFQSAVLFPLNIFYFLFSQTTAWTILIIAQPFISLLSVYLLIRHYKLSKTASIFSAVSYSFSLYMTTFLEYNTMGHFMYLIPLALLSIEWIILNKKKAPLLLSVIIATSGFAGHIQLFAGVVLYALLYLTIRIIQTQNILGKRIFLFLYSLFFIIIGIGIAGIQLLPGMELIGESARSSHSYQFFYNNLLVRPSQLVLYFVPDLFGNPAAKNFLLPFSYPSKAIYIGVATIYFAVFSFKNRKNQIWQTTVIITAILASIIFLTPVSMALYRFNLPFLSSSSPSNYIFMVSLGLCVLAGFGLDEFIKHKGKYPFVILGIFWLIMGIIFISVKLMNTQIVAKNFIYSTIILIFLTFAVFAVKIIKNRFLFFIFIVLVTFDLFYFFHKFNPFVPKSFVYPKTEITNWINKSGGIDRVWGFGYGSVDANFATENNFYSPDGYDPLYPKYYGELIQSSNDGKIATTFNEKTRSDAIITRGFGEDGMMKNPYRLKILSIMGVKYILDKTENGTTAKTFPPEIFENIASVNDFRILKYKNSAPRFFLTNSYNIYKTKNDFENKLFSSTFNPKETILLNQKPAIDLSIPSTKKQAKLIKYSPNSVVIETTTDQNALLYLSDTYYPGWKVFVDNNPSTILRANYAFRAVVIPSGSHKIEFKFSPSSFKFGFWLSFISIVLALVTLIIKEKIYNKNNNRKNESKI